MNRSILRQRLAIDRPSLRWCLAAVIASRLTASAIDSTSVFNEIMYNPAGQGGAEWIELHNQMAVNMDLSGWRITGGVNFTIPAGTTISAGGYLTISSDTAAVPGSVGPWTGSLDNSGELIRLRNVSGRTMDEIEFSDGGRWPAGPDGSGASLAKRDPGGSGGEPDAWSASWQTGGTPNARNFPDGLLLGPAQTLVGHGGGWLYNQSGVDMGTTWAQSSYVAGTGGWQSATAAFAYDETPPPLSVGTTLANPATLANPVCYFQKTFTFSGDASRTQLSLQLLIDDGAVVYLNGNEVARVNMPAGVVTGATRAAISTGNAALATAIPLPSQQLGAGLNTLSVSLHDGPADGGLPPSLTRVAEGGTMDASSNVALASRGAVAFAKDVLPGYPAHAIPHLNDGTFGNPNSWIGNSLNSFCGINLGAAPVSVSGLAFGRDNTGTFTDRTNGAYTLQFTTVPNPTAATPDGSWTTFGTLNYAGPSSPFFSLPSRRHLYEFPAISATGVRMICPGSGLSTGSCVDEIELYGPRLPDAVFDLVLTAQEILPLPGDTRIVINEIAGAADAVFRVELKNESGSPINLGGVTINGFSLPATTLAPGAVIVFDETQLGFRPSDGDRVFLYAAGGGTLLDAAVVRPNGRARSGERMLVPSAATFGAANSFSIPADVVINEIMYHAPPFPGTPGVPAVTQATVLVPLDATWRYNRANIDPGPAWASVSHPVGGDWLSGQALLGFETTPASLPDTLRTPFATSNAATYYFETDFPLTAEQLASIGTLRLEHAIDDGAAFYVNGVELVGQRFNMPASFSHTTPATLGVGNAALSTAAEISVTGLNLHSGLNRFSIEVHNQIVTSNDMVCGARLSAGTTLTPAVPATPVTANPEEWIELYNKGAATVDLSGWKLDDAVSFTFPAGTMLAAGDYLVIAGNAAALKIVWPERAGKIIGNFSGNLSNSGERIELEDTTGNPADEVRYFASGWHDGGGSSLELRDVRSDNSQLAAWADSDETIKSTWQTFTLRANAAQAFGPTTWNEFRLGMLDAGECLIDDLRVRRDPDGAAQEMIQNGNFEALPAGDKWRFLGNHRGSAVIPEPGNPGNSVLRLSASGPTETNHNHAESTFVGNAVLTNTLHEVSFRARWLAGTSHLNTRAYYQKLAKTWELPIPARLGTPGAANSRVTANAGPVLSSLRHAPAVPPAGNAVTVSVEASDPDEVASATLRYRLNGVASFSSTPMTLTNGVWSAALPGQAAGAIVHFYVEALDSAGALSLSPPKGPDSRALVQWADSQSSLLPAHQLRLIMLNADRDFLLNHFNRLSNERIPGTLVYRGTEVFHDVGVRLQGTAAGRVRDGEAYPGYDIGFPPDHLFRGVHDSIGIDRSGRAPVVRQQDEFYVRHTFNRAGIPCTTDDLCHFIAPAPVHTGTAILQLAAYGGIWTSSQYGDDGTVFNFDITYDPISVSIPGNSESLKPPVPFNHVATDFANLGNDKEQYRGPFDIRAGKRQDDYTGLIRLCQTMAKPDAQLAIEAPQVLDLDQVLRCTALVNLWGIADTYYTGGLQHNIRLFVPADGDGVNFLPWDLDFVMSGGTSSALMPAGNALARLINIPGNRRLYLGHVRHLCDTVFKSSYLTPWLNHFGSVVGQNFGGAASYVDARCAYALTQLPANVPYAITTNGGADYSVAARETVIEGTGWIDIHDIRRAGSLDPVAITWITQTQWRATLPLAPGANSIALEAYGFDGTLLSTRTITITNTLPAPAPRDFLRITEMHYHPADPSTAAELAASASDSNFEFIEIKNIGTETLSLSGVHFATGIDFSMTTGTTLAAGQFAVIVRQRSAFEARYGTGVNILGEYLTDALSNGGETVTLLDSTGATIQSFTYADAWFPSADGPGWSMVAASENAAAPDLNTPAAWAISYQRHGNPGAANGPVFATEFAGWRYQNFTATELADPSLSGSAADPAREGVTHFLRYALGIRPRSAALLSMPTAFSSGGVLRIDFRRLKRALDIDYIAEAGPDAFAWTAVSGAPVVLMDNGDGTETVRVETPADTSRKFVRLRVRTKPY